MYLKPSEDIYENPSQYREFIQDVISKSSVTEKVLGVKHPERGLLSPGEFLPAIENNPISIQLGEWVIATALSQIAAWQALGTDVSVSVNINALQLQQDDFAKRLQTLLSAWPQIDPRALQLEILETSAIDDLLKVSKIMHDCIKLGVSFALDDFGTGYSIARPMPARDIPTWAANWPSNICATVEKIDINYLKHTDISNAR